MTGRRPVPADAIIVAAGASSRMGGRDKLLVPVAGRPLLARTIEAFAAVEAVGAIIVVTSHDRGVVLGGGPLADDPRIAFVPGGDRRQDSVRAGFAALESTAPDPEGRRVVLVHDGARPRVTADLIAAVLAAADRYGSAIPVVPIAETVKRVDGQRIAATVDRASLATAQTPQGIRRSILRDALASPGAAGATWTDEAALLEACRIAIHAVPGDPANLKVTVPADLARLDPAAAEPTLPRRAGIGHDAHPFGPGAPLRLGGIDLPGAPALHGHSDGDVVLHAIADALLGAAGLGDLGRLFPAGPTTPVGIDSRALLATVIERLAGQGWRPAQVDLTIVGARPRLAAHLEAIRESIAGLLALDPGQVNVKASTGNLDGAEGAGRSLSTLALVSIERAP